MRLIVNADDFGLSRGVNLGIIEAHKNGIVTSTTLMVTMNEVEHALELAKNYPKLGIGLHLNCTLGKPITKCPSLTKENGKFYKPKEKPNHELFDEEEIYQEFMAQYNMFVKLVGNKPTHLDSHLYSHQIFPKVKNAALRIALEKDIAIRDVKVPNFDLAYFIGDFRCINEKDYKKAMNVIINKESEILKHKTVELMCHPAYLDRYIYQTSSYSLGRVRELDILTSKQVKDFIKLNNIELITFKETRR